MERYEEFSDNEYPKIGEMKGYNGFCDYMRLRKEKEGNEEIIMVKAQLDFIKEE
jgi:hypothetical protein